MGSEEGDCRGKQQDTSNANEVENGKTEKGLQMRRREGGQYRQRRGTNNAKGV